MRRHSRRRNSQRSSGGSGGRSSGGSAGEGPFEHLDDLLSFDSMDEDADYEISSTANPYTQLARRYSLLPHVAPPKHVESVFLDDKEGLDESQQRFSDQFSLASTDPGHLVVTPDEALPRLLSVEATPNAGSGHRAQGQIRSGEMRNGEGEGAADSAAISMNYGPGHVRYVPVVNSRQSSCGSGVCAIQ